MKKRRYTLTSKVVRYPGMSGWHFMGVDKKHSTQIKENFGKHQRGFGSIPVSVTLGQTTWDTSIFPDSKSGQYVLPLKASIRKKEGVCVDDTVQFSITIR